MSGCNCVEKLAVDILNATRRGEPSMRGIGCDPKRMYRSVNPYEMHIMKRL
jgi:hypothetical protein